jgi:hypothetical protein
MDAESNRVDADAAKPSFTKVSVQSDSDGEAQWGGDPVERKQEEEQRMRLQKQGT